MCRSALLSLVVLNVLSLQITANGQPTFNRDIRPILASKCFACHGPDPDQRQAGLRLDVRDEVIRSGAIDPDELSTSALIQRVMSSDPEDQMPPPDAGHPLSESEKRLLRGWVLAGAEYQQHWAFVAPQRSVVPETNSTWPRNPIDHFVLVRLSSAGTSPSPQADPYSLVRRLYLDLIGLPPTPQQADAFARDPSSLAYERLVDELLQSELYGERWARAWLDLARYADTNGYEKDRPRTIWPYRDWVIRALNQDMPFDQFTIEQLAGDMLPNATEQQRIATGFHRNTMLNEEGGIDPLEYRFYAMVDRVATTGTVWMGLTVGCAQCHSHKYDPISHAEYYQLLGLLNNADEPDLVIKNDDVALRRREIEVELDRLWAELPEHFPPLPGDLPEKERRRANFDHEFSAWVERQQSQAIRWLTLRPTEMQSNLPKLELLPDGSIFSTGDITKRDVFQLTFALASDQPITALRLEVLPDERLPANGPGRTFYEGRKGDFFLSEMGLVADGVAVRAGDASHSYGKISIGSGNANANNLFDRDGSTGWATAGREGERHQLVVNFAEPVSAEQLNVEMIFERHFAASLGRFRFSAATASHPIQATDRPADVDAILVRDASTWKDHDLAVLRREFARLAPELAEARKAIEKRKQEMPNYTTTMVMQPRASDHPRKTFRRHRGEYLSAREEVVPGIPALFDAGPVPNDRLSFARWLVSDANPLVARVTVNRAWQAFFGHGLVATSDDFGTRAVAPMHASLLDWLACEFVDRGWSLKKLHRLIVLSATYQQSSEVTAQQQANDPHNDLLARGPRLRVDAETVRDVVLHASGLLSKKMFGPSVYPPQPRSVTAIAYGGSKWNASTGEDRYRRSLYTFSKRTAPFAAFTVFDAPTGENCVARRERSNTPLQALTLLNDEMYLEMARAAAQRLDRSQHDISAIATELFRRFLTRPPSEQDLELLVSYFQRQYTRLHAGELSATAILAIGDDVEVTDDILAQAAWAMTARAIMNLDEVITKR